MNIPALDVAEKGLRRLAAADRTDRLWWLGFYAGRRRDAAFYLSHGRRFHNLPSIRRGAQLAEELRGELLELRARRASMSRVVGPEVASVLP